MNRFLARTWNRVRSSRLREIYDRLPPGLQDQYRRASHWPARVAWQRQGRGRNHAAQILEPLRDRYLGQRAIIMGNGPSLKQTDWDKVRNEFTIGTNRIYLLADEMGFHPSAYCCVNGLVLEQFHSEISRLPCLKLLDWRSGRHCMTADPQTVFLPETPSMRFHQDLLTGWNPGYTVTFAALQTAFFLGFETVILIGVDHRFRARGPAMREISLQGEDSDHFTPDYFGFGVRWHLPNLSGSEVFYKLAHQVYTAAGRQILDATAGGALEIFPKVSLDEALATSTRN